MKFQMKITILNHSYGEHVTPVYYFLDFALAKKLAVELNKEIVDQPDKFFIQEIDIDNSTLDQYGELLKNIKAKFL